MSAMESVYSNFISAFYRRHTPYMGQPDYRIHELNKRLQQRSEVSVGLQMELAGLPVPSIKTEHANL
jgi:LIM domain-binding protein 1